MKFFTPDVIQELKFYVYRLVDPRNGQTFYVGKGKGNRIFAHIKYALNKNANDNSLKIQQIRDIQNNNLEVIHLIHRHGMTENEALEVEAALIDCYAGLTNILKGNFAERGVNNAEIIQQNLSAKIYEEPNFNYIIVKISNQTLKENNNDLYETTRKSWKVNKEKIKNYKYCFCVKNCVVNEVYKINNWQQSSDKNYLDRFEFIGEVDTENSKNFKNKRIPKKYRKKGMASPLLYCNNEK